MGTNFFLVTGVIIIAIISYVVYKIRKRRKAKAQYGVHKDDSKSYQNLSLEERQFIDEWSEEMIKRNS